MSKNFFLKLIGGGNFNFLHRHLPLLFIMAGAGDEINSAKPQRSYLITYSQADFQKFQLGNHLLLL